MMLEIRHWLSYTRTDLPLQYWRSTSQFEVDCVLAPLLALEIKATNHVDRSDLRGLQALREEGLFKRYLVVSQDPRRRVTADGIEVWPYRQFLDALWAGKLTGA